MKEKNQAHPPAPEKRASSERIDQTASAGAIAARLAPAVRIARSLVGKVGWLALLTGGAALLLWGLIIAPFDAFSGALSVISVLLLLGVLCTPALLLALFWIGLRTLLAVPDRLVDSADTGLQQAGGLARAAVDRRSYSTPGLLHFYRSLTSLRDTLLESKMLLLQFAAVARLLNPIFVVSLLVAFVAAMILIAAAAVAGIVVLVF